MGEEEWLGIDDWREEGFGGFGAKPKKFFFMTNVAEDKVYQSLMTAAAQSHTGFVYEYQHRLDLRLADVFIIIPPKKWSINEDDVFEKLVFEDDIKHLIYVQQVKSEWSIGKWLTSSDTNNRPKHVNQTNYPKATRQVLELVQLVKDVPK